MNRRTLLASVLALTLLTGCGGREAPEPETASHTEYFRWEDLTLAVTEVFDISPLVTTDKAGETVLYTEFTCSPESIVSVLDPDQVEGETRIILRTAGESGRFVPVTRDLLYRPQRAADLDSVRWAEEDLPLLSFCVREQPPEKSRQPWDRNGDGLLQIWEFPVPDGPAMGLEGADARLYTLAAQLGETRVIPRIAGDDTALVLPVVNLYGSYDGQEGETHYVCVLGYQFFYDLGTRLGTREYSRVGGQAKLVRLTLNQAGELTEVLDSAGGTDSAQYVRKLCGPLTEVADSLIRDGRADSRSLVGRDDELLERYMDTYFPR